MTLPQRSVCLLAEGAQNYHHLERGIPRYVGSHVRALYQAHPGSIHSVLLNPDLPLPGTANWLLGRRLVGWSTSDRRVARKPASAPRIFHVMSPFEPSTPLTTLWPTWARDSRVATVVTLYDLIPLVFQDRYLVDPRTRAEYLARLDLVRHADQVLAISHGTATDAIERLGLPPSRVHVIDAGANDAFSTMYESPDDAWKALSYRFPTVQAGFMLYVGGFEFRKNLEGAIAGYARLPTEVRRQHQLVIVCKMLPEELSGLRKHAREMGLADRDLILTGYVTDSELGALYHACTLFVFPSLYEGSGLPILEAMSCGAPVAASVTSTFPEILGDTEATFDPTNPESIAECLRRTLASPDVLARLRARSRERVARYTWEVVAERSLEGYERALSLVAPRKRLRRPRIALVTPWPPERSGIADYNLRLAAALGQHVDVEVIVRGEASHYPVALERGVRVVGSREFLEHEAVRPCDRAVYCMGNSHYHEHVHAMLCRKPGAVVLHDVRLTGFYGWLAGRENAADPVGTLAARIAAMYGRRMPPDLMRNGAPDWSRQQSLGIYMTREIQALADACFVHSRHGLDVLELDRGMLDRATPVAVLPFGMPAARPDGARRASSTPLVVSLGVVSEVKGIATLIDAFGRLSKTTPAARLVIAGDGDRAEFERWRLYARERAPEARISIPGHVGLAEYGQLVEDATLAVQLRLTSNGEASASVADCLAAGVPTIVSDLGWTGELPDTVVSLVATDLDAGSLYRRMEALVHDPVARARLSEAGRAFARENSFERVAAAYLDALELG